jgi:hypothetical protein
MIETRSDFNRFCEENVIGNWILHVVPTGDIECHPATVKPCLLFIRNIYTGKTYYYSFCHPDSHPIISQDEFVITQLKNSKNIKWALDKKIFIQLLPGIEINDANLCGFLKMNEILDSVEYSTTAHFIVRRNSPSVHYINQCIPLLKHKEAFDDMADDIEKMIKGFTEYVNSYSQINQFVIEPLAKLESTGLYVDKEKFGKYFYKPESSFVYTQYNIYTSTGRPNNRFGGVNYAALNHKDGSRSCFVSRFGKDGRMVLMDYTAFHPHIVCNLINYKLPIGTDIYKYLAKLYFLKEDVDDNDVDNSKQLTFKQFYGGVEEQYSHIKYLASLKCYVNEQWEKFKKYGYVETPFFQRKITEHHISDPNPTKLFNYILQAAEGEIAIPKLKAVQNYLEGHKSKAILYTYDSILFDFCMYDGPQMFTSIRSLMGENDGYPIKTYIGKSYQDLQLIDF